MSRDEDAAEAMRSRLQADLRQAMKKQDAFEVTTLRVLIATIDNAGAVPLPPQMMRAQHEVERRRLSCNDVLSLLRREHAARRKAACEYARLGNSTESERALREMAIIGRYIPVPDGRVS